MNKSIVIAAIAMLPCFFPSAVNAAALGDLVACPSDRVAIVGRIPLLDVEYLNETEISAQLASDTDIAAMGIQHSAEVKSMAFYTDFSLPQAPVVRVSGCAAQGVASLQFVMELRWPRGRLFREYSVRLEEQRPSVVETPPPAPAAIPMQLYTQLPADNRRLPSGARYMVNDGDTVWRIASRIESRLPVARVIEQLVRLNPGAFMDGDVERLRADVILQIP